MLTPRTHAGSPAPPGRGRPGLLPAVNDEPVAPARSSTSRGKVAVGDQRGLCRHPGTEGVASEGGKGQVRKTVQGGTGPAL